MPSNSSWKDAYLLSASWRAEASKSLGKLPTISAADIANADFRKKLAASPIPLSEPNYQSSADIAATGREERIKKGGWDGFLASTEKVADTPVIKEALNVLSTGTYAAANTADNAIDAIDNLKNGNLRGISDLLMSAPTGVTQGINAGIGQNAEDATTFSDVIDHGMRQAGVDNENDAAKWVKGIGGFAGDVLLDPTTYATFGASAAVKGAVRGAKESSRGAKSLAEDMLKVDANSADQVFKQGAEKGATVGEVAANKHGRVANSILEGVRAEKDWRSARAKIKADRKAIKNDTSEAVAIDPHLVGVDVAAHQADIDANMSEAQKAAQLEMAMQTEREAASIRDASPDTALPTAPVPRMDTLLDEIQADITTAEVKAPENVPEPIADTVSEPIAPVEVSKPEPVAVSEKAPEGVKNLADAINGSPVVKSVPNTADPNDAIQALRGKTFDQFDPRFQTPVYKDKKLIKALAEPDQLTTQKIIEGKSRQVPVPLERQKYKTSDFVPLNAEGKDVKKAQSVAAKTKGKKGDTHAKDTDYTVGPQQADDDFNPFIGDDLNPAVPTIDDLDNFVDMEKLGEFAVNNPDHMLTSNIKGGGTSKMSLESFVDKFYEAPSEGLNRMISDNLHFFSQFGKEGAVEDPELIKEIIDNFKTDFDSFHGGDKVDVAGTATEADIVGDVLDAPEMEWRHEYETLMEDNPNKWSPELAKGFAVLKADHHGLSPQEIMGLTRPMNNSEIKRFIKNANDDTGLKKGELEALRKFTGKETREEIADAFVEMKALYNKHLKDQKNKANAKTKQPTRQQNNENIASSRPIQATEANIEAAKVNSAEAAQAVVENPDALNAVIQQDHRVREFHKSLDVSYIEPHILEMIAKDSGTPAEAMVNAATIIKDSAHQAVKNAVARQFKGADFETKQKYRTDTQDVKTGNAWRPDKWGSNSQLELYNTLITETLKKVPDNAFARRRFFMASLHIADKELRAMGVEPYLNHVDDAVGKHSANLSVYDIFRSIEEVEDIGGAKGGGVLQKLLFSGQKNAYTLTQIQGAVETMLRMRASGKSEEAVMASMKKTLLVPQYKNGRPWRNDGASVGFIDKKTGALTDTEGRALGTGATRARTAALRGKGKTSGEAIISEVRRAEEFAKVLTDPRVYQKLNYNMLVNHAEHASTLGQHIDDLSVDTMQKMKIASETQGPAFVLGLFQRIRNDLAKNFNKSDLDTARAAFDAKLAEIIEESERAAIDTATKRERLSSPPKTVEHPKTEPVINEAGKPAHVDNHKVEPKAQPRQQEINATHVDDAVEAEKAAADLIEEAKAIPTNAIVDNVVDQTVDLMHASVATAAFIKMHPIQRLMNPALGFLPEVINAIKSGSHSIARQQAMFHETLDMHLRKYSPESLMTDFKALQEIGRNSQGTMVLPEDIAQSAKELYGIIGTMFEVSAKNVFARNGIGAKHFNKLARANGLHEDWYFHPDKGGYENGHLWTEWQGIEEKGVQDFLSRMHSVTVKASQEIAIAADFSMRFGSRTPKDGYVKLKWTNQKTDDASFFDLVDQSQYYPREIAGQIISMDRLMAESRAISSKNVFGRFIINVFDPITNALKAHQTTVRPGHWVVSITGDLMRNQIAGVNSVKPYQHSIAIMKAAGIDTEEFIGKIASAGAMAKYRKSQEIATGFQASGEGKGVTLFIGGKKVNVSYETLNQVMSDVVMLPKHRGGGGVLEDRFVGEAVTSKLARGLEKATDFVTDNPKFSLNDLAAKRDNFMRIALAIDFASKQKWGSLKEMKQAMETHVVKWAPTSTDMTAFEAKYARRTMLYYTWLRGITPRIIDSAMTRPGVTTMVPKALYNIAAANGLNPESIGNPFPEDDGLFPSYYYNNVLGPQWKDDMGMWGINPSSPVIEVANTFSRIKPGDPVGNAVGTGSQLLGMATPFARMPIEGAMQSQANGIPITDGNQYLADNLGGSYVGALSRATGKTINPGGILEGNGIIDRTDSAAKDTPEDQAEHAKLQAFNFLTGLKLTDYKSDSAKKAAYYDQLQKFKDAAKMNDRSR